MAVLGSAGRSNQLADDAGAAAEQEHVAVTNPSASRAVRNCIDVRTSYAGSLRNANGSVDDESEEAGALGEFSAGGDFWTGGAVAAGFAAASCGTMNAALHFGHATCLPLCSGSTCILVLQ